MKKNNRISLAFPALFLFVILGVSGILEYLPDTLVVLLWVGIPTWCYFQLPFVRKANKWLFSLFKQDRLAQWQKQKQKRGK